MLRPAAADGSLTFAGVRRGRRPCPGGGAVPMQDELVVVGVDGSPSARHAVAWAAQEAARRESSLLVVHVVARGTDPGAEPSWLAELVADARQQHGLGRVDVATGLGRPG